MVIFHQTFKKIDSKKAKKLWYATVPLINIKKIICLLRKIGSGNYEAHWNLLASNHDIVKNRQVKIEHQKIY
jgi:hypothetical protein